jgi:hypothetical protein
VEPRPDHGGEVFDEALLLCGGYRLGTLWYCCWGVCCCSSQLDTLLGCVRAHRAVAACEGKNQKLCSWVSWEVWIGSIHTGSALSAFGLRKNAMLKHADTATCCMRSLVRFFFFAIQLALADTLCLSTCRCSEQIVVAPGSPLLAVVISC